MQGLMQITLIGKTNDGEAELPMKIDVAGGVIIFTIKGKDNQFSLKDFDDAEAFLKEKGNKSANG